MGVQNRAHIEELQRYCRERDDLVNDLESKVRSQEDAMKIYKKVSCPQCFKTCACNSTT